MIKEWLWKVTGAQVKIDALESDLKLEKRARSRLEEELAMGECKEGGYCAMCENAYRIEGKVFIGGNFRTAGYGCKKKIRCISFVEADNGQKPDQE